MTMRKLLLLLLLFAPAAFGQNSPGASYQWGGNITAANAACVIKACVGIQLPSPIASTISVGLTGTWSATLAVEESQDGGRTYTSAGASLTSNGTTTYTITAFTNFRVRASAFVSGNAGVNLQVGASGSGGGGGGTPGGSNTEIQFNDSSSFGGDPNLTWDKTTGSFNASGGANGDSSIIAGTNGLNGMGCQGDSSGNFCDLTATELAARVLLIASGDVLVRPNLNGAGGKLKVGLATGAASGEIEFEGKTSGAGEIGVADVAGTPNKILLPIATGTANTCLQTDGGSPQQTSWTGCGNATAANSGFAGLGSIYPNAPPYNISFDGKACYGANVSWTNASTTVTVDGTNCAFTSADTGKKLFGTNGCCANLSAVAAVASRPIGTMTFVNSTTATVVGNSTGACTSVSTVCEIHWFTDDRAKWCCGVGTVDAAWQANNTLCPTVILPAGWSPIPFGLFNSHGSLTCASASFGKNSVGAALGGPTILGQGLGTSVLLLPPDSDFTKCTGGGGTVCLFNGANSLQNFTVNGGNFGLTGTNNNILVGPAGVASFNHLISLTDFGSGDLGALVGFAIPFSNVNDGIYVDQFGSTSCSANATDIILTNAACGDSKGLALSTSGTTNLRTHNVQFTQSAGLCILIASGTTWYSVEDSMYSSCGAGANPAVSVATGAVVHMTNFNATAVPAGYFDGIQLAAGAIVFARDSAFAGATTCIHNSATTLTSGAFFNQGGNTCVGHNIATTLIPTWTSTGTGTTPCVPTTDTSSLAITGNESGTFTCTAAAGAAATGTFTITFAGTFSTSGQAPSCNLTLKSGTGAWTLPAAVSETASSTTSVTWSWFNTGTLTPTSTYKGAWTCTPR